MNLTPTEAIFLVLKQIPKGRVATYGQVAQQAGLGRAARYVGTTLKGLPKGSQLPWHRVINAQGRISFPEHHPNHAKQKDLLMQEGVEFNGDKIALSKYQWQVAP